MRSPRAAGPGPQARVGSLRLRLGITLSDPERPLLQASVRRPDRYVQVPGTDGPVSVPGHWERRLFEKLRVTVLNRLG